MPNKENIVEHQFKPGESGNPKGRPRKSFASINLDLEAKGIKKLSKTDLIDAYSLIFNSTQEDLKVIIADKHTPFALKLIITELNDKKARARAMADYRDYMFGKAQQSTDVTTNGEKIGNEPPTITFVNMHKEEE